MASSGPSDPAHTTFVQADPTTFRALVQKLTGASTEDHSSTEKLPVTAHPTTRPDMGPRRPAFKLQERRQGGRKLEISLRTTPWVKGVLGGDHNAVLVSPVSPFDLFSRGLASPRTPSDEEMVQMEERAIAEKGFYLHPSPRGPDPPELLPLFPLHSPRESN
ncbi:hypothetical protein Scep_008332 [Stephania cephalantha]|uniref:VQ domain-containing protein n=1 Tax=Stephania cephalantha TaxID=152367 RepID=A0AAP0PPJ0_9MAGN